MGKRMWLSLFILSGVLSVGAVVGNINPFEYIGNKAIAVIANEQEEPKPEVKVGKPQDLIKCAPPEAVTTTIKVLLREALDGKDTEGNERLPKGYKYAFFATENNANNNTSPLTNEYVDIAGEPKAYWVRVYSVVDDKAFSVYPITVNKSTSQDCSFNDQLVSLSDMYQSGKADGTMKFDIATRFNTVYYGQNTKYIVRTKGIDGKGPINIIDQPAQPLDPNTKFEYNGSNNEVIEIEVASKDGLSLGTREFRLHIEEVLLDQYTAKVEGLIDSTDKDGKNKGTFDLSVVRKQLRANQDSIYLDLKFFERVKNEKGELIDTAIVDINKYVYDEAKVEKVYATVVDYLLLDIALNKTVQVQLVFSDRPLMNKPLTSKTYCFSEIKTENYDLTNKDKEALDKIPENDRSKYVVSYHITEDDAKNNVNPLVETFVVKTNEATKVWVRLSEKDGTNYNWTYFYVSAGYNNLKTEPSNERISKYYQYENNEAVYTVDLTDNDSFYKGKLENDKNGPALNPPGAKLEVAYYTNANDAALDQNRMSEKDVRNFEMRMGYKSELLYARVVMPEGFECIASDYSAFYVTLGTIPSIEYLPKDNKPSSNPLYLCRDGNGVIAPVALQVKNVSKYPVKITWQKEEKLACTSIITGQLVDCFLPIKKEGKDEYETQILKVGEIATLERTIAGKYQANVEFEPQPFKEDPTGQDKLKGANSRAILTETWTVNAPPVLVVDNVDATGMINSMEIDEKGETEVVLGVVGLNGELTSDGYEFAIDNGGYQPSTRFYNVPIGQHIARAKNTTTGCTAIAEFSVFGYPKYFTPNGDGYNDTWNIPGLKGHNEARIYIYDKSGRLLKQLSPYTEGWDGTWNGKQMPSTDYWFTVEFVNDYKVPNEKNGRKVSYKGHFSLKR